jgi:hypothetical protein
MSRRRIVWLLSALTVLAFGLRFAAILYLHAWKIPGALEHRQLANNLLAGFGFSLRDWYFFGPSSVQGPIYPLILAGLFKWLGPETDGAYAMAMATNAFVGAACVPLLYQMIRKLGASQLVGLIGAALIAIWPTQIYAATYAQPVVLVCAAVIGLVTLFYRATRDQSTLAWVAFSILAMLSILLEPVLLWPMLATFIFVFFIRSIPMQTRVQFAAIMLAAAVLIIGPWSVRNTVVHQEFVPVTSTFWPNFWKGNNPHATGTDRLPISEQQIALLESGTSEAQRRDSRFDSSRQFNTLSPQQRERLNHQPEIIRAHIFRQWAMEWVTAHPLDYARLCVMRLGKTLWADMDNPKAQDLYSISRAILLLLSFAGAGIAIRTRTLRIFPTLLFVVPVAYFTFTLTGARYALPYEPLQLAAGAYAVATIAFSRRACAARPASTASDAIELDPEAEPSHA